MKFDGKSPYLQRLLGLAVEDVFWDGELLGISFRQGWRLTIYNKFTYRVGKDLMSSGAIQRLKGSVLMGVEERRDAVTFILSDDQNLQISLSDGAYSGPEAMQLNGPSSEIVIWN